MMIEIVIIIQLVLCICESGLPLLENRVPVTQGISTLGWRTVYISVF